MYSKWQLARKYLHYYFTASNGKGHGVHSPFVYDFIRTVLNDKQSYPVYSKVEMLRKELLRDHSAIQVNDLGAGSVSGTQQTRRISSIARNAAKSPALGQLLFRVVKKYQPLHIIELGTSLGISAAYLASGNPAADLVTIEGSPEIARKAGNHFKALGIGNIRQTTGDFDQVLPVVLDEVKSPGLVFIDGNHRYEPTIRYFEWILPFVKADSILIFDDIHWSAEMEKAWLRICAHPAVSCSIDLFFIGMIFFRSEFREKQDFRVRF